MPEASPSPNIGLYRSGITSPERLRQTSVGREHLLDNAIESLRGSLGRKSKHHMLFIGPRGIGKTHLLSRIEDAVQSDGALNAHAVVVRFPEESNQTLSFADFLIGLCRILKDVLEDEPKWTELFNAVETDEDDNKVIDTLVPAIREQSRQHSRTLVVMLENLGEIFTRQIRNQDDIASLRKFLMADNGCLLLATAPLHFQGITDIDQPFYDFFDIQILENLTFDETVEVIQRNLEWDGRTSTLESLNEMRPQLQALYRMTGGNPRLTMMLYELIAHESVTQVQDQFHLLLDRISPFYQSRLNDLPPSQRALLECLARMRDQDKTPATIAARMRMSQQETSSLLKRLSDAHYLCAAENPEDKRSRLYRIREGFFDIWLAMNLSRTSRKRLPFLLEFFSLFYPSLDAREEKRKQLRAKLAEEGNADAEKTLDYLSEVGSDEESQREIRHRQDLRRQRCRGPCCPLRARSGAIGGGRREPSHLSRRHPQSVRPGLPFRNRGNDRVLGTTPKRPTRSLCPTNQGNRARADASDLFRSQADLSAGSARNSERSRGAHQATHQNRVRAEGACAVG